jgi:hypothetical protein
MVTGIYDFIKKRCGSEWNTYLESISVITTNITLRWFSEKQRGIARNEQANYSKQFDEYTSEFTYEM